MSWILTLHSFRSATVFQLYPEFSVSLCALCGSRSWFSRHQIPPNMRFNRRTSTQRTRRIQIGAVVHTNP